MTEDEYFVKKEEIENEISDKLTQLDRDYAEYHSPAEVGDIVSDRQTTILVEKLGVLSWATGGDIYLAGRLPITYYHGPKLTKKGVPYRNGATGRVYQSDLKNVIKKAKE